jgi:hypothetical protein
MERKNVLTVAGHSGKTKNQRQRAETGTRNSAGAGKLCSRNKRTRAAKTQQEIQAAEKTQATAAKSERKRKLATEKSTAKSNRPNRNNT